MSNFLVDQKDLFLDINQWIDNWANERFSEELYDRSCFLKIILLHEFTEFLINHPLTLRNRAAYFNGIQLLGEHLNLHTNYIKLFRVSNFPDQVREQFKLNITATTGFNNSCVFSFAIKDIQYYLHHVINEVTPDRDQRLSRQIENFKNLFQSSCLRYDISYSNSLEEFVVGSLRNIVGEIYFISNDKLTEIYYAFLYLLKHNKLDRTPCPILNYSIKLFKTKSIHIV